MAYNFYEEEYAREDFSKCVVEEEPKVCLTIVEAKKILDALDWIDGYMYCNAYKKDIEAFKTKIEKAERGHE